MVYFFPVKTAGVRIAYLTEDMPSSCDDRKIIELITLIYTRACEGNSRGQCLEYSESKKHACSRSQERTA